MEKAIVQANSVGRWERERGKGGLRHDGRDKSKLMERVATIIETMFN